MIAILTLITIFLIVKYEKSSMSEDEHKKALKNSSDDYFDVFDDDPFSE